MRAVLSLLCALLSMLHTERPASAAPLDDAESRAMRVLRVAPLVDTHNDLPAVIRRKMDGDVEGYDISVRARFDTDIPRLRAGKVGTQFWSVYVQSDLPAADAMRMQLEQIDLARRLIASYPDDFGFATSVADIERERRKGRIASLLGIEGAHTIGNSLGALRSYYDLGVRYMTLTHFHGTDWADSATDTARHGGMTRFGEEVIGEMNRLGMMVDLSHVSVETMEDALRVTRAPVIFSHSSARALTDHVRNVPDSVLSKLRINGGVAMVAFIPVFVSEEARIWAQGLSVQLTSASSEEERNAILLDYTAAHGPSPRATIRDVADHIEHIAKIAGADHVGIGADFYGAELERDRVAGLEDVSEYPALFAELVRRGWSDEHLRKLARENLLRVFSAVESVAVRLRRSRLPSRATIEHSDRSR